MVKQVIDPRIPLCWLEHLDDEKLGVVDTEIESLVSQDLLKRALPSNLSLNSTTARLG